MGMADAQQDRQPPVTAGWATARPLPLVLLHWATLVPLLAAFGTALLRDSLEERALRALLLAIHQGSGALVLALAAVRLLLRWQLGRLPATAAPRWTDRLAAAVQVALYAALFVVPLLGWAALTAADQRPPWGWRLAGNSIPTDEDLAEQLRLWHACAAYTAAAVIGLHALAALWHHFVLRDGVLHAMRLRGRHPPRADTTPISPPGPPQA